MTSTLTKRQAKSYGPVLIEGYGKRRARFTVSARFDDDCGNGHNTFALTGEVRVSGNVVACGCLHDEIAKHFPRLRPFIKWHLCGADGPMHYIENSLYWAGKRGYTNGGANDPPNLDHFRSTAIWPDATAEDMRTVDAETLHARLAGIMADFEAAMTELGFTY